MSKILVRHGLSEANNRNNHGNLALAGASAPLMKEGFAQAREAGQLLVARYGVEILSEPAAVSTMRRTQETADTLGLTNQTLYPELQEVAHGMDLADLRQLLSSGDLPDAALRTAEDLLDNPPAEGLWVTHGLVIAGLCRVLGVERDYDRLIPRFCEIRELPIN